jgi:golgi phosphoprotein 3
MLLFEELFLLALNDTKGQITMAIEPQLRYGLSGAILAELVLAGKIGQNEKKHLIVLDATPTGNELMDEALGKISENVRERKASFWVNRLADSIKKLQRRVGAKLVDKGILLREEKRYLWVIPYDAYPMVDATAKYWVKQHLRQAVLTHEGANDHAIALLGLVRAIDMLEFVFTKDELKAARKQIDQLTIQDEIGNGVREAIEAIEAAAIAASMAATAG